MSKNLETRLFSDLAQIIEQGKEKAVRQVNNTIVLVYWQVGNKINTHILDNQRAEYSKEIVSTVSTQLKNRFGKSFEERNLRRMMQFAHQFNEFEIVVSLSRQLSWSHFVELLPLRTLEEKL
jgi:hypothetical protein